MRAQAPAFLEEKNTERPRNALEKYGRNQLLY